MVALLVSSKASGASSCGTGCIAGGIQQGQPLQRKISEAGASRDLDVTWGGILWPKYVDGRNSFGCFGSGMYVETLQPFFFRRSVRLLMSGRLKLDCLTVLGTSTYLQIEKDKLDGLIRATSSYHSDHIRSIYHIRSI